MNEIKIKDDFIKLDAALKFSGAIGTGGQAKMVIQDGLVLVNGEVCTMRGKKLRNGDTVKFENFEFVVKNEG
ncbi:MAG: RNA-binding S4 domain-containing protein [Clostridia bacterium]|nr:RNA-binding S4 domain-containing protein [Clostridia bacterium]